MYFAHGTMEAERSANSTALTITLVSLAVLALIFLSLWLLKHYTAWEFTKNKGV